MGIAIEMIKLGLSKHNNGLHHMTGTCPYNAMDPGIIGPIFVRNICRTTLYQHLVEKYNVETITKLKYTWSFNIAFDK